MNKNFAIGFLSSTCFFLLMAFSQINNNFKKEGAIYDEFHNLYLNVQSKQFKVVNSTPNLEDLKDKEIVIFSSGASSLMWRNNREIFAVAGSCVTVRR